MSEIETAYSLQLGKLDDDSISFRISMTYVGLFHVLRGKVILAWTAGRLHLFLFARDTFMTDSDLIFVRNQEQI